MLSRVGKQTATEILEFQGESAVHAESRVALFLKESTIPESKDEDDEDGDDDLNLQDFIRQKNLYQTSKEIEAMAKKAAGKKKKGKKGQPKEKRKKSPEPEEEGENASEQKKEKKEVKNSPDQKKEKR